MKVNPRPTGFQPSRSQAKPEEILLVVGAFALSALLVWCFESVQRPAQKLLVAATQQPMPTTEACLHPPRLNLGLSRPPASLRRSSARHTDTEKGTKLVSLVSVTASVVTQRTCSTETGGAAKLCSK
jgi:hypothetical protein